MQSEKDLYIEKIGLGKVKVNGEEIEEKLNMGIIEINKEEKIKIDISFLWLTKTYYVRTLPSDFPKYETEGESNYEGDYYLTTFNNLEAPYYLFKLDTKGNIKYYKKTENATFDFKKVTIGEEEQYTYLEVVEGEMEASQTSYCPTKLVIMNNNYEEIRYENQNGTQQLLENHGVLILGENHYILAAYQELKIENNILPEIEVEKIQIVNNKIEEIKDGQIL